MSENLPEKQEKKNLPAKEEKDEGPKRFVSKGPHVLLDSKTNTFWMKKDSWQDKGKYFNWHESRDYMEMKNIRKIGGFDDWRIPTINDANALFDLEAENIGKGGIKLHYDAAFPEGAFRAMWLTGDTSTRRPRFDLAEGKEKPVDEYNFGAVRLCRKDPVKKDQSRRPSRR